MRDRRKVIKKGQIVKLSIILFVALFACILLSSAAAQGSGVTTEGSAAELEVGSYIGQDEGTAPAYVAGNAEFFSTSANFISEAALGNVTLVFIVILLIAVFVATFVYSKFKKRSNKIKRWLRFYLVIALIFAVFAGLPAGVNAEEPENQTPIANGGPDQTVFIGETVHFDGSNSYDPDGTIVSYQWDFGDETTYISQAGEEWSNTGELSNVTNVLCLEQNPWCAPWYDSELYAGTDGDGLFRSTDKGNTWIKMEDELSNYKINSLIFYSGNLYAATNYGIYKGVITQNTNQEISWTSILPNPTYSLCISSGDIITAGTGGISSNIHISYDGGNSWNVYDVFDATRVNSILHTEDGTILAGTSPNGDIFISTNNGYSWERTNLDRVTDVQSLFQASNGNIIAGTSPNGNIFVSSNLGSNWNRLDISGVDSLLSFIQSASGNIYAGTSPNGKIYKSMDDGNSWTNFGIIPDATHVNSLLKFDEGTFYAGTSSINSGSGKVYKSIPSPFSTHSYSMPGFYSVILMVTDNSNFVDDDSITVHVLQIDVTPESLNFGRIGIGSTVTKTLTITNKGLSDVIIDEISLNSGAKDFEFDISSIENPPQALNESYIAYKNYDLDILSPGFLENDYDIDGDSILAELVSDVTNGILNFSSDGSFTYSPNTDFVGSDSFTYKINDGTFYSDTATVTIEVTAPPQSTSIYIHGDPSNDEQLILELINRARSNPFVEGARLGIDIQEGVSYEIESRPPLAFNPTLLEVSESHSVDMYTGNFLSRTSSDGTSWQDRISNAGYSGDTVMEIVGKGTTPSNIHDQFTVEYLHRKIVLGLILPDTEIGIGYHEGYLTEDYCNSNEFDCFIQGVVFNDLDGDNFYDPGEGLSGITIIPDIETYYAVSSSSGGYAIPITTDGQLTLTASGGDLLEPIIKTIDVKEVGDNVKQDFIISSDPINQIPLANDDQYIVEKGSSLVIPAPGLLINDSDDDISLSVIKATEVAHGVLTLNSDGSFNYSPYLDFAGFDSFKYVVSDGVNLSNSATVTLVVKGPSPVAVNDEFLIARNSVLQMKKEGILLNDDYTEEQSIIGVLVSDVSYGSLNFYPDCSFTYFPKSYFVGIDTFTYKLNDGISDSNEATVTIEVIAPTQPSSVYHHGDPSNDEQFILELINRARSDPFVEGTRLNIDIQEGVSYEIESRPPLVFNSTLLQVAESHSVDMYTNNFFGHTSSDGTSWWDRISNAGYSGDPVMELLSVGADPEDNHNLFTVNYNYRKTVLGLLLPDTEIGIGYHEGYLTEDYCNSNEFDCFIQGVVFNDLDGDNFYDPGEGLGGVTMMPNIGTYYAVTSSSGGYAIPITTDGQLTITATGGDLLAPIMKTINVLKTEDNVKLDFVITGNDLPISKEDSYIIMKNQSLSIQEPGVLRNDLDPNEDSLSAILITDVKHGQLTFNSNGSFSYTPSLNYSGEDFFEYMANDGKGNSARTKVTITTHDTICLLGNGRLIMDISFTPTKIGNLSDTLTISTDVPFQETIDIPINGIGIKPEICWINQFGSTKSDESWVVASYNSEIYITGFTFGALPNHTNLGATDGFIWKFDSNGSEVWSDQFGTSYYDHYTAIDVDSTGVYGCGAIGVYYTDPLPLESQDASVYKYDHDGNIVWSRQFGTTSLDTANELCLDSNGLFVVGDTHGAFADQTQVGGWDAYLSRYDIDGNQIWIRQFGTSEDDHARSVASDDTGIYVVGYVGGTLPGQNHIGDRDAFIRKYSYDGNIIWTHQFGTSGFEYPLDVSADSTDIYVVGYTTGSFENYSNLGGQDAFIIKYDSDGDQIWIKQYGTSLNDWASEVTAEADGIYVSGETLGALYGETNYGDYDVYVLKLDTDGNQLWTYQFGTNGRDWGSGISVDSSGIYITGYTEGAFLNYTNAGGRDIYVAMFGLKNTQIGSDVSIVAESGASVKFDTVTSEGITNIIVSETAPEEPVGYYSGGQPRYYDITTTATTSGEIEITIDYSGINYVNEANLKMLHYEDIDSDGVADTWVDVTTFIDTENKIIKGVVTSLSYFTVMEESPDIMVSEESLDFGEVDIGSSVTKTVTVTNDGISDLTIDDISFSSVTSEHFSINVPNYPKAPLPKDHEFNYTINAAGTEGVPIDFDPNFNWYVRATGTDTWYSTPTMKYQLYDFNENPVSPLVSNDEIATSSTGSFQGIAIDRINTIYSLFGNYTEENFDVNYKVGCPIDESGTLEWSNWYSNGNIAKGDFTGRINDDIIGIHINVPNCDIEYRVGYEGSEDWIWSKWVMDGPYHGTPYYNWNDDWDWGHPIEAIEIQIIEDSPSLRHSEIAMNEVFGGLEIFNESEENMELTLPVVSDPSGYGTINEVTYIAYSDNPGIELYFLHSGTPVTDEIIGSQLYARKRHAPHFNMIQETRGVETLYSKLNVDIALYDENESIIASSFNESAISPTGSFEGISIYLSIEYINVITGESYIEYPSVRYKIGCPANESKVTFFTTDWFFNGEIASWDNYTSVYDVWDESIAWIQIDAMDCYLEYKAGYETPSGWVWSSWQFDETGRLPDIYDMDFEWGHEFGAIELQGISGDPNLRYDTDRSISSISGETFNAQNGIMYPRYGAPDPAPRRLGGFISDRFYTIYSDNPEIRLYFNETNTFYSLFNNSVTAEAEYYTLYSTIIDWQDTETGSASIGTYEGTRLIKTSSLKAPNADTTWSVTDDNTLVDTNMGDRYLSASAPTEPIVLSPQESIPIEVTFSPTTVGNFSDVLQIHSNDPENEMVEVSLNGYTKPIYNVEKNLYYTTIQSAIDDANSGDKILVGQNTYYENLVINKPLTLIGRDNETTIINGGGNGTVVKIYADDVTISNFNIVNGTGYYNSYGIWINGNNSSISHNNISDIYHTGIYVCKYKQNTSITYNTISDIRYGIFLDTGSKYSNITNNIISNSLVGGIYLRSAERSNITNNEILNFHYGDGIYLYQSSHSVVSENNISSGNSGNGIRISYCPNSEITNNTVSSCWSRLIIVSSSENCTISNNTVTESMNEGIYVGGIDNSILYNNTVSNCSIGIYLRSSHIDVINNTATNNDRGIIISSHGNITMRENVMKGNNYNFGVYGQSEYFSSMEDYIHDIDRSNTVDGKPIYYWVNKSNWTVSSDAGFVGVINSTNITVENLTLENNDQGVLFVHTDNSRVFNITFNNVKNGIHFDRANNNQINNNIISNNEIGIHLIYSDENKITYNNLSTSSIDLFRSLYVDINNNIISDNTIYLVESDHGIISGNELSGGDIDVKGSLSCNIENNTLVGGGHGIYVHDYSENCTVANNNINNSSSHGINIKSYSHNCIVTDNIITNSFYGIQTWASDNIIISNNEILECETGMKIRTNTSSQLTNNDVSKCSEGLIIDYSKGIVMSNNTMSNNDYNFGVTGASYTDFEHVIDTSNTVNHDPIYYWVNKNGETIPSNAGYIGIISSSNIIIENNQIQNNYQGILLINSSNVSIYNVNLFNNYYGIYQNYSNNNTINESIISGQEYGMFLYYSNENNIIDNDITGNYDIYLRYSDTNYIYANDIAGNEGIYSRDSDNNQIINNNITSYQYGLYLSKSFDNLIRKNNFISTSYSNIYLTRSENNTIEKNDMSGGNMYGIQQYYSRNNNIKYNSISDCTNGISIWGWSNNYIIGNSILECYTGIRLYYTNNNVIFHNNFLNNTIQIEHYSSTDTIWDNGFGEGNYWSDYYGVDDGSDGRVAGDGIGDTVLPHQGVDNYPLIRPYGSIKNLDTEEVFLTIRSAIDDTDTLNGHTISIASGHYPENLMINKSIKLVGEDEASTIIDGYDDNAIEVTADFVQLSGFTAVSFGEMYETAGIYLNSVQNCKITNTTLIGNYYGIQLYYSDYNDIMYNTITFNEYGIFLKDSSYNHINHNELSINSYNIFIDPSLGNQISDNLITNGDYGIYLEDSDSNTINNNTILENNCGILLDTTSDNNTIYNNNLIENDVQATDSGTNTWDDGAGTGNFWSDYTGSDSDGDGIGDTPHVYDENPIIEPPSNAPPLVDIGGPYEVYESTEIIFDASGSVDYNDEDILQYRWDLDGDGTYDTSWSTLPTTSYTWYDEYTGIVMLEITDGEFKDFEETTVTVNNMAPIITSWDGPIYPVDLNVSIEMSGTFTDPGTSDTHTAIIDWGDGTQTEGIIVDYTVSGTHAYSTIGVYIVTVTISDNDYGSTSEEFWYIAIYDSTEGHVTGGGWIDSPVGAYTADPTLTGKANFGFVSKYQKGKTIPTGNTEFQFKAGDLNFHSSEYQWLVVAGAKAQFKGTGTINGLGEYKFMISAIDSDDIDQFRIKIWLEDEYGVETVIYDNGSDTEEGEKLTEIGGGCIVIHTAKK